MDIGDDGFESLGIGYGWLGEDKVRWPCSTRWQCTDSCQGIIYCKVVSDFGVCIFDLAAHAMRVLYRVLKGLYVWVNLNEYAPTEFCEYALKFEKDEDRTMFWYVEHCLCTDVR